MVAVNAPQKHPRGTALLSLSACVIFRGETRRVFFFFPAARADSISGKEKSSEDGRGGKQQARARDCN